MSDYMQREQGLGRMLRSFMAVILAVTVAFAFSGISATQFAYAEEVNIPVKYVDESGDAIDGEADGEATVDLTDGAGTVPYSEIDQRVIDGYTFSKITYVNGEGEENDVATDAAIPVQADTVINVVYTKNEAPTPQTFTVTFNADNGTANTTQTVEDGKTATKPATDPTKDGFTFEGWMLGDAAYDFSTPVTGNITLTASWKAKTTEPDPVTSYTVTFDADNGTANTTQTVESDKTATKPATDPTKEGFTFEGWTLDGAAYDFSTPVTGNITLTASWKAVTTEPDPAEKTVTYTVNYVGADPAPAPYTRTETVEDDAEGVIAIWEEDINKTVAGYKIASVKLENGTAVKAGDEISSGSTIIVTYEKIPVKTGAWVLSGNRWWYKYSDGTWPANEWLQVNGKYYHFDSAGWMQTGWLQTNQSVNNVKLASNKWFYLNGSGDMITGWVSTGGVWYYLLSAADITNADDLGVMVASNKAGDYAVQSVKGKEYCFASSGAMGTGWKKISGTWFFFDGSGAMVTNGWAMSGSKWFWLGADGSMATSSWVDGNNYYVDASGAMLVGWAQLDTDGDGTKNWYYFNASGKKYANQWFLSNGKWYWFNTDATMAESSWVDKGNYYVSASGAMVTGWNRIGTNSIGEATLDSNGEFAWYYFNASGMKITNGWVKSGGNWYWLGTDGSMVENDWVDNGNYYMDSTGIMVTGWKRIGHDSEGNATLDKQDRPAYYYFNPSGLKITNAWVQKDGQWYWFGMDGSLVQGAWVDSGKYWVNDEGVYVPGYKADPEAGTNTTE